MSDEHGTTNIICLFEGDFVVESCVLGFFIALYITLHFRWERSPQILPAFWYDLTHYRTNDDTL